MLNAHPIDIETFHQLTLRAGTVIEVHAFALPMRLVEVVVDFGQAECRALVTVDAVPPGTTRPWIGARVVVIEDLFPLSCASKTYTATLLTAGEPEQIVILDDDFPNGATLF